MFLALSARCRLLSLLVSSRVVRARFIRENGLLASCMRPEVWTLFGERTIIKPFLKIICNVMYRGIHFMIFFFSSTIVDGGFSIYSVFEINGAIQVD